MTNMRQWDSAVLWFQKAMELYTRAGDVPHAVGTHFNLAENYYAEGEYGLERVQFDSIAAHPELIGESDYPCGTSCSGRARTCRWGIPRVPSGPG